MLLLNTKSACARSWNILVSVKTLSQLDFFYLIFWENRDYTFYVLVGETFCLQDIYNSKFAQLPNLILNCDSSQLISKIEKIGMVLTTESSAACLDMQALLLFSLCSELDIPVVEMQHSIVQYGVHYHAEVKSYAETKSYGTFKYYINVEPFAEHLLSFYPVTTERCQGTVIGFPKYHLSGLQCSGCDAGYILIFSNFNFECYTPEDLCTFSGCILKAAAAHPEFQFVWKTCTETEDCFIKNVNLDAYENITLVQSDQLLSLLSLESLIKNASKVISTLSTVLLDCEAYRKNTILFKCESVAQLFSEINNCCTFSNSEQLIVFVENEESCLVNSGKLREFDNSKFRNFVEQTFSNCRKARTEILKQIARYSALIGCH